MASQQEKAFCVLRLEVPRSVITVQRGKWPRGPAVSKKSELLVAHEKLRELPLLTV
jgi:hypothetical protein